MESERKTIKLQTLTPVHIGSGEILKENFDYIKNGTFIHVLDRKKLFRLLTKKGFTESILANALLSKNIKTIIDKNLSGTLPKEFSLRRVIVPQNQGENFRDDLREQIYDGFGKPYIPGSSIKGAIRTALLSCILEDIDDLDNFIKVENINDDKIIEEVFVKRRDKEEYNLMQCLQVNDCYFENTILLEALNTTLLNIKKDRQGNRIQTHANQIVECIPKNSTGNLSLKITDTETPFRLKLNSLQELFEIINSQTKTVLECEKDFWEVINDITVNSYLDTCSELLDKIKAIEKNKENSCILRLGFASGYNFMTNKWTDFLSPKLQREIAKQVRGDKDKGDKEFPKTRRINITGADRNMRVNLLGFVKLTIEE